MRSITMRGKTPGDKPSATYGNISVAEEEKFGKPATDVFHSPAYHMSFDSGRIAGVPESEEEKMQRKRMESRIAETQKECLSHGFRTWVEFDRIYIETPNGKWYFFAKKKDIVLMHKNYRFRQSTMGNYHKQFTKDISVHELMQYIARHDKNSYKER